MDATVDAIDSARGPSGPALAVTVRVTSEERSEDWSFDHEVLVVEENGELRICARPDRPEG